MKKINKLLISIITLVMMSQTSYAHSGRTDSNGGHWNHTTGTYHYHSGSDRTVEYKTKAAANAASRGTTSSNTKSSIKTSSKPTVLPDAFVLSNMRTFVNGYEMPTFSHSKNGGAYIIVEDLKDYGFDTFWDNDTKTLTVMKNSQKIINPLPMDYYRGFGVGYRFFTIENNSSVKVLFKNRMSDVGYQPFAYSCSGYMAICIDELKAFTEDWNWNGENLSLSLNMR